MRPQLSPVQRPDMKYDLQIVPHKIWKASTKTKIITQDELDRILAWQRGSVTIQTALPHWSPADRGLLLTGMDDAEFKAYCGEEDNNQASEAECDEGDGGF